MTAPVSCSFLVRVLAGSTCSMSSMDKKRARCRVGNAARARARTQQCHHRPVSGIWHSRHECSIRRRGHNGGLSRRPGSLSAQKCGQLCVQSVILGSSLVTQVLPV